MARDLDVTQPRVWRWVHQSKQLPSTHVLLAEKLYGVSRHDLRPDIYPRDYPPAPDASERFLGVDRRVNGREYLTSERAA